EARGAQRHKIFAQHRVDIERAADVVGGIDGADLDVRLVAGGEDRAQVLGRPGHDFGARDRAGGDAAAEAAEPAGRIAAALAEEVDGGDQLPVRVAAEGAD